MAACGVGLVAVVASIRREAAFYVALAPVLAGSLILSRFDLWPRAPRRGGAGGVARGPSRARLGTARRRRRRQALAARRRAVALAWSVRRGHPRAPLAGLAVTIAVFLPFAVIAPHGLWSSVSGQLSRPLQIESLGAAILTTFGHPAVVTTHGSQNVAGHGADRRDLCRAPGRRAACALGRLRPRPGNAQTVPSLRRRVRRARSSPSARCSRRSSCSGWSRSCRSSPGGGVLQPGSSLTSALLLTQVWFPQRYWQYAGPFQLAWVVLLRDLVLVALVGVLAWPAARGCNGDMNA